MRSNSRYSRYTAVRLSKLFALFFSECVECERHTAIVKAMIAAQSLAKGLAGPELMRVLR